MLQNPRPADLHISTFNHAWDATPKPVRCTVGALIRALTTFPVADVRDKRSLPGWSPARFVPGAPRRADAVLAVSCLVLDVDEGAPDAAFQPWPDLLAVMHSTWSHRPDAPRFRLVLPLLRPVPGARWGEAWALAAARAVQADGACKDASRLYFRPALPSAGSAHFAQVQRGPLLDLLGMLPADPPPPAPPAASARPRIQVPARLAHRAIAVRLGNDPESRTRAALELGARILGEGSDRRATQAQCPACQRPSVWFYLAPQRLKRARCNHRNTCGWAGSLDQLFNRSAA